ncbi:hypothetical protein BH11PSE3_BH11PSE3_24130 [soil metagenome]
MERNQCNLLLELFIEGLPDSAVILLDADGNILSWNAGAESILGYDRSEIVGRHFSHFHIKDDPGSTRPSAALEAAVSKGRFEETSRRLHKDRREIEVRSLLMPLRDAHKKLVGFGNLLLSTNPVPVFATPDLATPILAMPTLAAPVLPTPLPAPTPREPSPLFPPPLREKILVVDDDERVRDVALNQLISLGYEVIVAADGAEAIEILERVDDIDLLFTDVVMPGGMTGREVARQARLIRPGLKVLFTSGYFEGALVREGTIEESVLFLVKPYRKKELAQKVAEVLRTP